MIPQNSNAKKKKKLSVFLQLLHHYAYKSEELSHTQNSGTPPEFIFPKKKKKKLVTIPSVPHWLSMGLNMCLLAPRHPSLISRFSGVSSTWGSYHLVSEPLFTSSIGSNAVWAAALWSSSRKGLLGEARALPQSKSHHGR